MQVSPTAWNTTTRTGSDPRPTLIGYLPSIAGIPKTAASYAFHSTIINTGDIAYTYATAMLASGRNFVPWIPQNIGMTAEEVNEKFSRVIFAVPCRIAPAPYDNDGYGYEFITRFIEKLEIPFFSLTESVQLPDYEYRTDLHKTLSPKVVRYLKVIAERSPVVGTRGHYSAEVLGGLGIKNVMPVGCPSLYLNGPTLRDSLLSVATPGENRVATCYSNYYGNARSRIRDFLHFVHSNNFHYVEQSFGLVTQALYYPGKTTAASIRAAKRFYLDLDVVLSLLKKGQIHYFTNYQLWKDFLGKMDFVFGARMHGLTPAIHAGVPSMFIAHDARLREMCEFFHLPFVAEHELPEKLDLEFFLSRCDYSAAFKSYPQAYQGFVQLLRAHGMDENISPDGTIIDSWEPVPDAQIAQEEASPFRGDFEYLEKAISISDQIPDEVFSKLSQIETLAQEGYLSRRKRQLDGCGL